MSTPFTFGGLGGSSSQSGASQGAHNNNFASPLGNAPSGTRHGFTGVSGTITTSATTLPPVSAPSVSGLGFGQSSSLGPIRQRLSSPPPTSQPNASMDRIRDVENTLFSVSMSVDRLHGDLPAMVSSVLQQSLPAILQNTYQPQNSQQSQPVFHSHLAHSTTQSQPTPVQSFNNPHANPPPPPPANQFLKVPQPVPTTVLPPQSSSHHSSYDPIRDLDAYFQRLGYGPDPLLNYYHQPSYYQPPPPPNPSAYQPPPPQPIPATYQQPTQHYAQQPSYSAYNYQQQPAPPPPPVHPPPSTDPGVPPAPPADPYMGNYGYHGSRYEFPRMHPNTIDIFVRSLRPYHVTENPERWITDVEREARRLGIHNSLLLLHVGEFFRKSDCESVKTWWKGMNAVISKLTTDGVAADNIWATVRKALIDDFDHSVAVEKAKADLRTLSFEHHMDAQTFLTKVSAAVRQITPLSDNTTIIDTVLEKLPSDLGRLLTPATQYTSVHDFVTRFIACAEMIRRGSDELHKSSSKSTDQATSQLYQVKQPKTSSSDTKNPQPLRNTPANPAPVTAPAPPAPQIVCQYCNYRNHSAGECRKLQHAFSFIQNLQPDITFNEVFNVLVHKEPPTSPAFEQFYHHQQQQAGAQVAQQQSYTQQQSTSQNYRPTYNNNNPYQARQYSYGPVVTTPPDHPPNTNQLAIEAPPPAVSKN